MRSPLVLRPRIAPLPWIAKRQHETITEVLDQFAAVAEEQGSGDYIDAVEDSSRGVVAAGLDEGGEGRDVDKRDRRLDLAERHVIRL